MKKLFILLAVASLGFVACNNEAENKETSDSPAVKIDTPAVVPPATLDTLAKAVDTLAAKIDTLKAK
jgi:outer membrane murein-binding lipoprotein Lpp